jgi:hypothetical protein
MTHHRAIRASNHPRFSADDVAGKDNSSSPMMSNPSGLDSSDRCRNVLHGGDSQGNDIDDLARR